MALVVLGSVFVIRAWSDLPGWARVGAGAAGVVALLVGFLLDRGASWPRVDDVPGAAGSADEPAEPEQGDRADEP